MYSETPIGKRVLWVLNASNTSLASLLPRSQRLACKGENAHRARRSRGRLWLLRGLRHRGSLGLLQRGRLQWTRICRRRWFDRRFLWCRDHRKTYEHVTSSRLSHVRTARCRTRSLPRSFFRNKRWLRSSAISRIDHASQATRNEAQAGGKDSACTARSSLCCREISSAVKIPSDISRLPTSS